MDDATNAVGTTLYSTDPEDFDAQREAERMMEEDALACMSLFRNRMEH